MMSEVERILKRFGDRWLKSEESFDMFETEKKKKRLLKRYSRILRRSECKK
jgi:hypothetical protein